MQHYPSACGNCPCQGACRSRIAERRYEYDIVVNAKLVEHQQMECCCSMQDQRILLGQFPGHIKATKQYGLKLAAFASALSTVGMVSIDRIHQLLRSVFQVPISTGTIHKMLDRLIDATNYAVKAIKERVKELGILHFDETGLRANGSLHWLHCACDENWSYFSLQKKEAKQSIWFSKVKQKVSGSFRTLKGAEDYAATMSYISSAAKHGMSYFDAIKAALVGDALHLVQEWGQYTLDALWKTSELFAA